MYIGAASGAVTVGLALFLLLMSQTPEPSKAGPPKPEKPATEAKVSVPPAFQTAVRLPPPPAPARAMKPRGAEKRLEISTVEPLKPRPEPAPKTAKTAVDRPMPPPERTASPPPEKPAKTTAKSIAASAAPVSREAAIEGRALLKMLETGKGPVIEIAWPANPAARTRLYALLAACHGMQTAMLADRSKLYSISGVPGSAWRVNRDAVSGFVRRPAGVLTDAEQSVIRRIKARHRLRSGVPVRLFPRAVDATLLGGLGRIVGPGYLKHRTIRARYRLSGDRIAIVDTRADGKTRDGGIVLPRIRRCN